MEKLGISQFSGYDAAMEADIGARVRARMKEALPKGTTQADIAERIRLTPDAFSRSLNGKRAFTATELVELAELLNTSAHWFITGEPDPFAARVAGRHDYDWGNGTYTLERSEESRSKLDTVVLAYRQAKSAGLLAPRVKNLPTSMSASECRSALISEGGDGFVRGLADLIENNFDVDIVRISGLGRDFVVEVVGRFAILVNETPNWFRENFGILHELAHILHGDLAELGERACADPAAEARANAFAANVLMPSDAIRAVDWENLSTHGLAELVWKLGVSTEALAARISKLEIPVTPELGKALDLKTQALLRQANVPATGDDEVALRMRAAATRRFPAHLVEAHRIGVSKGILLPEMLAWILDVDVESVVSEFAPSIPEPDIEWLGRELGLLG